MWYVYVLYSISGGKSYTGLTNDVDRRLFEHNVSAARGFTLRYRPWSLIRSESFETKDVAMRRERFLKSGKGREEIKRFVNDFLTDPGAVSAVAEKD